MVEPPSEYLVRFSYWSACVVLGMKTSDKSGEMKKKFEIQILPPTLGKKIFMEAFGNFKSYVSNFKFYECLL